MSKHQFGMAVSYDSLFLMWIGSWEGICSQPFLKHAQFLELSLSSFARCHGSMHVHHHHPMLSGQPKPKPQRESMEWWGSSSRFLLQILPATANWGITIAITSIIILSLCSAAKGCNCTTKHHVSSPSGFQFPSFLCVECEWEDGQAAMDLISSVYFALWV